MTIVNKRNAVVGWLTLKVGKVAVRRKLKQVRGQVAGVRGKVSRTKS